MEQVEGGSVRLEQPHRRSSGLGTVGIPRFVQVGGEVLSLLLGSSARVPRALGLFIVGGDECALAFASPPPWLVA